MGPDKLQGYDSIPFKTRNEHKGMLIFALKDSLSFKLKKQNMHRIILLFALALLASLPLSSQEFSAGFRAGLNFSTINGPLETDDSGNDLEDYTIKTGFHVGAIANLKFNDIFGLRGELLYSQKGTQYSFVGPSYWVFYTANDMPVYATGNRNTTLTVTNSYIDIPVTAVGRLGRLELSGGLNLGILISSRGTGQLSFSGQSAGGSTVDPFTIALEFNYFDDTFQRTDATDVETRRIDGKDVLIPKTLGAYYQTTEEESDKLFNTLELGLIGGLAFYLNQGLYLSFRANYGLSDLTKTNQDISKLSLDASRNFIFREDDDRNLTLQASVGFSF